MKTSPRIQKLLSHHDNAHRQEVERGVEGGGSEEEQQYAPQTQRSCGTSMALACVKTSGRHAKPETMKPVTQCPKASQRLTPVSGSTLPRLANSAGTGAKASRTRLGRGYQVLPRMHGRQVRVHSYCMG